MLTAINPAPTIRSSSRPGPGPVAASVVGVADAFGTAVEPAAEPEVPEAVAGATTGATTGAGVDVDLDPPDAAVVGVPDDGVAVVGVVVAAGGGADGGGVVEVGGAANFTTVKPPTLFPETSPGAVSPTKVYRGEPL
jgi:hypothetical protein